MLSTKELLKFRANIQRFNAFLVFHSRLQRILTEDDCRFDYKNHKKSRAIICQEWFTLSHCFSICNKYRGNDLLNEPTLVICNTIPTMGVLRSLTVERDKID